MMQKNLQQLLEDLLGWLKFQKEAGVEKVPAGMVEHIDQIVMANMKKASTKATSPELDLISNLAELKSVVERCELCDLSKTRNHIVFGEGSQTPILMIIGEAPGREEDLKGRPFIGRSGELLTKMLRAINIDRKDVFITSVIKCRPPGNRTPLREEIDACLPYLKRQIELLDPRIILCLGATAAQSLLEVPKSLSSLRGKFYDYKGKKVAVTYHPAYLLRFGGLKQKDLKRRAWHDLQMLQREYEKHLGKAH